MIVLYGFPRSGGTLLSTILTNHPDVVVTPELHHGRESTTGAKYNWEMIISFVNLRFGLQVDPSGSFDSIYKTLEKNGKLLIYRAWIPGYVDDLKELYSHMTVQKNIVIVRNFFHVALSAYDSMGWGHRASLKFFLHKLLIKLIRKKIPEDELFYWFDMYKAYIEHIFSIQDKFVVHYEDLVADPRAEVRKVLDYLRLSDEFLDDCLRFDFSSSDEITQMRNSIMKGDSKIRKTSGVKRPTKYPRWRIKESSYEFILDYLKQYPELKHLDLA